MFTLAHMSDLHIGPLPTPRRVELINKRLFGYLNWHNSRKSIHHRPTLDRLAEDLTRENPDHVAITGDLVNLGLREEYLQALDWLQTLGTPEKVSVVPGNHDAYVPLWQEPGIGRWNAFMSNDDEPGHIHTLTRSGFPYVRRRGDVVLIGLSSAIPTMPLIAAGRLGGSQRERLAEILQETGRQGLCRVLLIHHPPMPLAGNWVRGLRDAYELKRVLARHGAELILHGHDHDHAIRCIKGPEGRIPVVGIPSASVITHPHKPLARYNLYYIDRTTGGWQIEMEGRGVTGVSSPVKTMCRINIIEAMEQRKAFRFIRKGPECRGIEAVD